MATFCSFLILQLLVTAFIGTSHAVYQRWLPNTNFENPANWNAKRAPCGNDVVIIPDESPVVYVQMNTTIKELVLPKNGELIFSHDSGLSFSDSPSPGAAADCPDAGGDLEFIATHPKSWLNPSSWCYTSSERGDCDTQTPLRDVERVPCAYDDVIFPRYKSFFVDLTDPVPQLTVKSVKIAGTSFTTGSLASYLKSDDGKRLFRTSPSTSGSNLFSVTRTACTDMKGCACGNDQPQIAKQICSHVEKTCRRPRCKDTIQPVGACCRTCGAVLNITRGYGFHFDSFKDIIKNTFLTDQDLMNSVNVTMSITYDGWVQIAINDVTGEKSSSLANQIKVDMDIDLENGGHRYAIDKVELMFSTGNPLSPSPHTGSKPMSGGTIAGIVIAIIIILIILAIVVIAFVFHRTGREIPVNIPKLPSINLSSLPRLPVRMPRATARVPGVPQTAAHVDPGFANPLYDTSPFDDGNQAFKEMELVAASQESQPTFETSAGGINNPLYGGDNGFSDPAKVDDEQEKVETSKTDSSTAATPTTTVLIDFTKDEADNSTI